MQQAKLLSPLTKTHANAFLEKPFHRSFARAGSFAEFCKWPLIAGVGQERGGDPKCPRVRRVRKPQRNRLNLFQLIEQQLDQVELCSDSFLQSDEGASVQHQLSE